MKIGKVPEAVLNRAVIKQLHYKRPEVILGPGVGEDCAALALEEDEILVLSTDPITGTTKDIGNLAIQVTANDLASAGAEPIGVMVTILLPDGTKESVLKEIMEQLEVACQKAKIQILGGHTEVTAVVNVPVVSVTGVAKAKRGKLVTTAGARPGMDLIATKWVGIEGTSIIAKEHESKLKARFGDEFIESAKALDCYLSVVDEAAVAVNFGVGSMHDVTEGGIYGALWEVAEASGVGLEVEVSAIPIKQETVEICEYIVINPYQLISSGTMLIAAYNGQDLVKALQSEGIFSAVIGRVTEGKERVIIRSGERGFLESPKADELYKVV